MIPLGVLGQVYVVAASAGFIFIIANICLGHLDSSEDTIFLGQGSDGDGGAGDFSGDGSDSNFGSGDGDANTSGHHGLRPAGTVVTRAQGRPGFGRILLGLLSPMTISLYLAFFGLTGLVLAYNASWMGPFTVLPAITASLVVGGLYKNMIRWMMKNMHTSSHSKESDIIGQLAEVNTPIKGDRIGEVTFVVQSKRINSAARPATPGLEFKKGSRVLIVGKKDHLVFVEPCDELDNRFLSS